MQSDTQRGDRQQNAADHQPEAAIGRAFDLFLPTKILVERRFHTSESLRSLGKTAAMPPASADR
jgi:hypothetical protein